MCRTKDFYLLLLQAALLEIRFAGAEGNLSLGPALSDILHNVPGALRLPWTEERDDRIYTQIRDKANAHGLTELLDRMERFADRRLTEEAAGQAGMCPPTDILPAGSESASQTG